MEGATTPRGGTTAEGATTAHGASTARDSSEYVEVLRKLEAAQETDVVAQALAAAQQHLKMDASYITTIESRRQTFHAIAGDPDTVKRLQGKVFPLEQTYCMRMLTGEIPGVVPDTRAEPALRDLKVTAEFHAYIGVPVKLSNGRVHGTLCCVSRETRPDLRPEELRFMQVLADIIAARVEAAQGDLARCLAEGFKAR
jgi:GAF domain-containing protein